MIRPPENNELFDLSNERIDPETSINHLPDECMLLIFQLLSSKEILAMEQVNQHHQTRTYIRETWKGLCIEKKIRTNWSNLFPALNILCPEKFSYRTERAIRYFLDDRKRLVNHLLRTHVIRSHRTDPEKSCQFHRCLEERTKTIYRCFESVGHWNAYLANYILHDLSKTGSWDCVYKLDDSMGFSLPRKMRISDDFRSYIEANNKLGYLFSSVTSIQPAELLLQGLSRLADYQFQYYLNPNQPYFFRDQLISAHAFLKTAIDRGVTHASLLPRKVMEDEGHEDFSTVLLDLAMGSAALKDYRALEKYLLSLRNECGGYNQLMYNHLKSMRECEQNYPPMLIFSAGYLIYDKDLKAKKDFQQVLANAESLFKQGIEIYQKAQSPIFDGAWLIGAKIKHLLGKWTEADACMNEEMLIYKYHSFQTWELRAEIKEKLGDLENAILSLKKILEQCDDIFSQDDLEWCYPEEGDKMYRGGAYYQLIVEENVEAIERKLTELQAKT